MVFLWNFPLFTIILSLFSGVLCLLLPWRAAKWYTVTLECVLIALVSSVLWYTAQAGVSFTYPMGEFPAPWGNEIRAGALEALMALAFLIVLLCSVLGGWPFLRLDVDPSKLSLYFGLVNLLTAALMALVWTNDIFSGYVFLEIMTLASCGLLIAREIGRTTLAAMRYMIMNLLGSGLFLLGVVLLYNLTGHLLMVPMRETMASLMTEAGKTPLTFSLAILTIGLGLKIGLFPFYFWMPDAYGSATPTSAAILSSLVSKAYLFLLFKIYYRAIGVDVLMQLPLPRLLLVLGILGMLFGSVSALRSRNINRMVAFSSAAQIGYIFMGIGLGRTLGYTAALFQIIAHSVTKSLLFLTTPHLAGVSGDSLLLTSLQGSARRAKAAGFLFTVGAFSMVGIPLLAGFGAKLLFAMAAAECGSTGNMLWVMLALAASTLLNAIYYIGAVIRLYTSRKDATELRPPELSAREHDTPPEPQSPASGRLYFHISAGILTLCNLFLGLMPWVAAELIQLGLSMFA